MSAAAKIVDITLAREISGHRKLTRAYGLGWIGQFARDKSELSKRIAYNVWLEDPGSCSFVHSAMRQATKREAKRAALGLPKEVRKAASTLALFEFDGWER